MPPQPPDQTRKLASFIAIVVVLLGVTWSTNRKIRDRDASLSGTDNAPLHRALERLSRYPTELAMTMIPGTANERAMRHMNAPIIGPVDVLALGQSDADHMSQAFFQSDVRFYNGWISISSLVHRLEVFDDIVAAHGAPKLVLFDVRSGSILSDHAEPDTEPDYGTAADDPSWRGMPPFRYGNAAPLPWYRWYRDADSLLSLQQTERTLLWFASHVRDGRAPSVDQAVPDADTGSPFRDVALGAKSTMYRWLADGSRVCPGEVSGVLPPPPADFFLDRGDRHPNESRLKVLESVTRAMLAAGSRVMMYSPPMSPRVFADGGAQAGHVLEARARVIAIAERLGVDYCDATLDAGALHCDEDDFSDETHISRRCNEHIVKRLASGCAPRDGAMLKRMLRRSVLGL
jgi:hypothetical protein